ncbi:dedicator of cytokinesis protein 1-like isoform X1 [Asterias rubens]|uniref:dedicator of cytokinesis protein 1-like isoform X1 n=1 Tax=Asterias rubens TaxID=7604 RepID=UPI001454E543|nr:dedicator of cytokinesis protein 1-like isoform X1 [Asterias rubens]XP_033633194.1 dedicator of cytokinesis protein 1-like isoform X1 [Asterias rubens]XP_033633195.1 dedicator of cytokinesis protein 1-like isoform X1 [Asterias rubens]
MTGWVPTVEAKYAVAIYNFEGINSFELKLSVGDTVQILEECSGWYKGFTTRNRRLRGIFPKGYVFIKEASVESHGEGRETVIPKETPVVHELTTVIREWGVLWKQLYAKINRELFNTIHEMMYELIDCQKQIVSGTLPVDELKDLKQQVTSKIDCGNRALGLDLVIRDEEGGIQDPFSVSTVALFRQHETATQRIGQQNDTLNLGFQKHPKSVNVYSYNLFVNLKNVVCRIGEDSDVLMSLYDAKEQKHISESYVAKWSSKGIPRDISLLYSLKTIFTDLGAKDLQREKVFLVCQIIRIGRMEMKEGDNNKKYTCGLKRPFGVCAMDISDILSGRIETDEDKQHFLPFQASTGEDSLDSIVRKVVTAREINHKGQGIWVGLKMMPGDIKQVWKDYPHLMDSKTAIAKKMGFPEVIMPGDVRNDVYVTLMHGEFDRGNKPKARNVEVSMEVCTSDGTLLEDVIHTAAGEPPGSFYHSVVYYQVKSPKFCETVKVAIPIEEFCQTDTHLRITFKQRYSTETKDRQEKPFGVAYLRLMTAIGTTIVNGEHELLVYKCDKLQESIGTHYLDLPSTKHELERKHQSQTSGGSGGSSNSLGSTGSLVRSKGYNLSSKDSLHISTLVCSTKLTQNVDLLGLLKWKSDRSNLQANLEKLMKVDGEEVVKFLQDTLDALFNILTESPQSNEYDEPVFNALIFIIGLIADRKYQQFRPVLDAYVQEHYSVTFADIKLMRVFKNYLDNAGEKGMQDQLLKALKAMEYIFRFILRSRTLFTGLHGHNTGRNQFEALLKDVFLSLKWLMAYTLDNVLLCQGAAMKYLPSVLTDTLEMLEPKELAILVKEFLVSLPPDRLVKQKMDCIKDIVRGELFRRRDCRAVLLPMTTMFLKKLLTKKEDMRQVSEVLSEILDTLWRKDIGPTHGDISEVMHSLLRTVIQSVIFMYMDNDETLIGRFVSSMISILHQMTEYHYQEYINAFPTRTDLLDFLMEIFMVFRDLISKNLYPNDWATMIVQQNSVILFAMKQYARVLQRSFVRIDDFEFQLWNNFFHLAVAFVTQESLQLENFSPAKRNKILERYGDMRREVGFEIIRTMWNYLGKNKIRFIPEMTGPFLEVTLVPEAELRKATLPIFFDMMQCECNVRGNFKEFEREIISQLDVLVEGGHGDELYVDLFGQIIGEYCTQHPNLLGTEGMTFVKLVRDLMGRLLDYRDIIHEESKENRMSCTVNLLNFYKDIDRQDMYVRYLYKLCDLHLECDNYTEAGFALQLHADRLQWSERPLLTHSDKYPEAQTERQLKELLYYDIIDFFDKGKMWEKGILMCKELQIQYEKELFDYIQLGELLQRMAHLYDKIMRIPRPAPEYFKVMYIGHGFPSFLRNKVFIYRGKEYERLADFVAQLQQQFPNASMMNKTTPPDNEQLMSKQQILQVVPVQPLREDKKEFNGKTICDQILSYYAVNEVMKFSYSRAFHRETKDKDNEFKTMCIERTYFTTAYKLPGILRWFEVAKTSSVELSPISNAIENMEDVNSKLKQMVGQYQADSSLPLNPLSLQLNGVIDSAVMGGPAKYEQAFCTDAYASKHPENAIHIARLKELFAEQIPLVEVGLMIHRNKMKEDLGPFQKKMEDMFVKRKEQVEERYGKKLVEGFAFTPNDRMIQSYARRFSRGRSDRPLSSVSNSSTSSDTHGSRSSIVSNPDNLSYLQLMSSTVTQHLSLNLATPRRMSDSSVFIKGQGTPGSKSSGQHKDKVSGSPAKRNSKDMSAEDSGSNASTPSKEAAKPIILDEKISSARPLRKDMKKANASPLPRPLKAMSMHVPMTTSSPEDDPDVPPKLPPKAAYSDYSSLPFQDAGPNPLPPKKLSLQLGASPFRDKPPPLPGKEPSSTATPMPQMKEPLLLPGSPARKPTLNNTS